MKLDLGCGNAIFGPDWVGVDKFKPPGAGEFILMDFEKDSLPERLNGKVDVIRTSHLLEHLTPQAIQRLLRGCKRVLKSGGILYIEIPDFRRALHSYLYRDYDYFNHPAIKAFAPNGLFSEFLDYSLHQKDSSGRPEHITFLDGERLEHWLKEVNPVGFWKREINTLYASKDPLRIKYSLSYEVML